MDIVARSSTISNEKLHDLKVDPEFRDKIPPLTEAEYEQLRENILSDGEVYEPICIWNGTIIDGHNRWKVVLENPKIPYRIKEMDFSDKWEAFEWMYRKQLGRRNLTDEQKTYMVGKMYEARKNTRGGNRRSEGFSNPQNGEMKKKAHGTAAIIAKELGISKNTVERSEKFSKGVDAVKAESPEAAERILKGKSGLTKAQVSEISGMEPVTKKATVSAILGGTAATVPEKSKRNTNQQPTAKPTGSNTGYSKEIRGLNDAILRSDAASRNPDNIPEYTVEDLYEEIVVNAKAYVDVLRNTLAIRSTVLDKDRDRIRKGVQDIINAIEKVRDMI